MILIPSLKEKLITPLERSVATKHKHTLLQLLEKYPSDAGIIAKALHRSRYRATAETKKNWKRSHLRYINYGVELLHMQNQLEAQ